jgi:hypothetical protein
MLPHMNLLVFFHTEKLKLVELIDAKSIGLAQPI